MVTGACAQFDEDKSYLDLASQFCDYGAPVSHFGNKDYCGFVDEYNMSKDTMKQSRALAVMIAELRMEAAPFSHWMEMGMGRESSFGPVEEQAQVMTNPFLATFPCTALVL